MISFFLPFFLSAKKISRCVEWFSLFHTDIRVTCIFMYSLLENDVVFFALWERRASLVNYSRILFSLRRVVALLVSRGLNSSSPRAVEKNSFSAFLFQGIGGQGFNVIVNCIDCVSTSERAGSIFKLASLKFVSCFQYFIK